MVERAGTSSPPEDRGADDNMHMDDINIPLVAVSVVFFALLLAVLIASLQAAFLHYQAAERAAKILPRDDPRTEVGALWQKQRTELHDPNSPAVAYGRLPAAAASQPAPVRITIDQAIQQIAKDGE